MLQAGFKPGSLSECLLEFDTCSKLLGHQGTLFKLNFGQCFQANKCIAEKISSFFTSLMHLFK